MKKLLGISLSGAALLALSACSTNETNAESQSADGVQTVQIAHTQAYVPYDYVNEDGESDGFEVAVLKAVDELLPDYNFEYVPTSDEDLLVGVESGKYAGGTKGNWITEERRKTFAVPEEPIAASVVGITVRAEDAATITSLEDFAKSGGSLVPISPQSAQYSVIEQFNSDHPDSQIELTPAETFTVSDAYAWVIEGRNDAYFDIRLSFENSVEAEDGAYHDLADQLAYVPYEGIPTYPLFNKNQQELADQYDEAIRTLKEDGTIEELSQQYFGEKIFDYVS